MTWSQRSVRVYKNRTRGFPTDVWTKEYNDTATGIDWQYPEFKGYHAKTYWATLRTAEGPITSWPPTRTCSCACSRPAGARRRHRRGAVPGGDISLLDGIRRWHEIDQATSLGPESNPTWPRRLPAHHLFRFGGSAEQQSVSVRARTTLRGLWRRSTAIRRRPPEPAR